jgi:hypothetical protein
MLGLHDNSQRKALVRSTVIAWRSTASNSRRCAVTAHRLEGTSMAAAATVLCRLLGDSWFGNLWAPLGI